ncbi:uncharacterized protein J8A68_002184 [[Candida] subhashii]|uniref:Uncharacterized protein n=1 Tax=[Candida] subhashii TaxID=561895 RepID=A0A8J5QMJ5_9ASCO|nr:uncharacterized protein J8A68_002184 [[Candida] subhashii]KAG7664269.1 hypothetical protein J8A68_002184 [[Candida] subhashii]
MKDCLIVRKDEDYIKLEYDYNDDDISNDIIIIPGSVLILDFNIFINVNQLKPTNYNNFLQLLIKRMKGTLYWEKTLDYEVSYNMNQDTNTSFSLELKCNIFQILQINSQQLHKININLYWLTGDTVCNIEDMITKFNYMLTSWLFNMESQFPLIFCSIGRQFIKLNMAWYKRYYFEVFGTQPQQDNMIKLLQMLQKDILDNKTSLKLLLSGSRSQESSQLPGHYLIKLIDS